MFVYQLLFIGLYQLLKSEPLFKINRLYLLMSLGVSLVLPLLSFGNIYPIDINKIYVQWLQPINISIQSSENTEALTSDLSTSSGFRWSYYFLFYSLGLIFYSIWFLIRNRDFFKYLQTQSQSSYKGKKVVILQNSTLAFSFWNRIYLGDQMSESQRNVVLEHEFQHLRLKHSWDIIALELMQFVLWFNPLIYIYKKQLRQIHEFEADCLVTQNTSKTKYINALLNQNFGCQNISFVNSFNHSSNLKNRIKMLHKTQSKRIKYLFILPVICLAVIFSCTQDKMLESEISNKNQQEFFDKVFKGEPNLFDKLDDKPDLNSLLNSYDLDIKDEYTEDEEAQVALIIGMLKLSSEYKEDGDYQKAIDQEINQSEGLKKVALTLEDIMRNSRIEKRTEVQELGGESSKVPFASLDKVPHPSSCSGKTNKALKECVSEFIATHVNTNFDKGLGKELGLSGKQRVSVQFTIDKTGKIVNVRARAPHQKLEEEAIRVIKSIPQMIPGQVGGKNVNVLYGLPIIFVLD
jgi:hypothetical protein